MPEAVTFTGPNGQDPVAHSRYVVNALSTPTVGDMLMIGQVYRSRIRQRTAAGISVDGQPFQGYSTRGPYYFYPNRESGRARGGTAASQKARATAAGGRHAKTGRQGVRTPYGIRYDGGYAEAKAAHGRAGVDLYGMEQHTHMLDTILVRAGGSEVDSSIELLSGGEFSSWGNRSPCEHVEIGFYGPEAARAKGNNEGTSRVPRRYFFGLNSEDLALGAQVLASRMEARAKAHG